MKQKIIFTLLFSLIFFHSIYSLSELNEATPTATCVAIKNHIKIDKPVTFKRDGTINSFIETQDKGFIFIGHSPAMNYGYEHESLYVMKTDSRGKNQWVKYFGDPSEFDTAEDIIEMEDGFVISGNSNKHPLLMKIDKTGKLLWNKIYSLDCRDSNLRSLIKNSKNEIVAAGYIEPAGEDENRILFLKVDSNNGNTINSQVYRGAGGRDGEINKISYLGNNQYYAIGYSAHYALYCNLDDNLNVFIRDNLNPDGGWENVNLEKNHEGMVPQSILPARSSRFLNLVNNSNTIFLIWNTFRYDHSCLLGPMNVTTGAKTISAGFNFCFPYDMISLAIKGSDELAVLCSGAGKDFIILYDNQLNRENIVAFDSKNSFTVDKLIRTQDNNFIIFGQCTVPVIPKPKSFEAAQFESKYFIMKLSQNLERIW